MDKELFKTMGWSDDRPRQRTVLVCVGHGVCRNPANADLPSSWLAEWPNDAPHYVKAIKLAVITAARNPDALLLFSGGFTARGFRQSEAGSYRRIAQHHGFWGFPDVEKRTLVEEYSLDSRDNILYSLGLAHDALDAWPSLLGIVGWGFKAARMHLVCRQLGWPGGFIYLAASDPSDPQQYEQAVKGEQVAYNDFLEFPLQITGRLKEKRDRRRASEDHRLPRFSDASGLNSFIDYVNGVGPQVPLPSWGY